jgi:hypothetical protein
MTVREAKDLVRLMEIGGLIQLPDTLGALYIHRLTKTVWKVGIELTSRGNIAGYGATYLTLNSVYRTIDIQEAKQLEVNDED